MPGRSWSPASRSTTASGWCSIVAGSVPYGAATLPALDGQLLFTDYCKGQVWLLDVDEAENGATVVQRHRAAGGTTDRHRARPRGRPWVLTLDGEVLELRPG